MGSISARRIPSYSGRHFEQIGTKCQAGMLGGDQVDLEADSVPFQDKLDHATMLCKLGHVTDGQNRHFVQTFHDFVKPAGLRGAEENNLAVNGLLWSRDSLGDHIL